MQARSRQRPREADLPVRNQKIKIKIQEERTMAKVIAVANQKGGCGYGKW